MPTERPEPQAVAAWALAGVAAILGWAAFRLTSRGLPVVLEGLLPLQWVALAGSVAVFLYGEGVLALQRGWMPRVVARAEALGRARPRVLWLAAPLHAMGFVGVPIRVALRAWLGAGAIVVAVVLVRALPDPWRGIVDLAVATALAWGALVAAARALRFLTTTSLPSEPGR